MTKDEALKLALEALELNNTNWKSLADSGDAGFWRAEDQHHYQQTDKAITAIKAALAQLPLPVQEPVAFDLFLDSQDFYELMQAYRHCQTDAFAPFEAVKNALRASV